VRIDKRLNIVISKTREDGSEIHVHSTPISNEVFAAANNWNVISLVYANIMERGQSYLMASGPRIAGLMLRKVAQEQKIWDGPQGVEHSLIAEIHRLTNVRASGPRGWETYALDDALAHGVIDADENDEIEGQLIFFTVLSRMLPKEQRSLLESAVSMYGAEITLLGCSDYVNSLSKSTEGESSGETAAV
jgi:hypothetical protein